MPAALNTQFDRMAANAAKLDEIDQRNRSALAAYLGTNQDLTGPGLGGTAGAASLNSATQINRDGLAVSALNQQMIGAIRTSMARFKAEQEHNTAILSSVSSNS